MGLKGSKSFRLCGRLWIDGSEGTFLGYGRVRLLEKIRDCGSISAAARSMEMSYRRAWNLVSSMNRQSSQALVEGTVGGRGGGGAVLTEEGERAIEVFWSTHRTFEEFLAQRNRNFKF